MNQKHITSNRLKKKTSKIHVSKSHPNEYYSYSVHHEDQRTVGSAFGLVLSTSFDHEFISLRVRRSPLLWPTTGTRHRVGVERGRTTCWPSEIMSSRTGLPTRKSETRTAAAAFIVYCVFFSPYRFSVVFLFVSSDSAGLYRTEWSGVASRTRRRRRGLRSKNTVSVARSGCAAGRRDRSRPRARVQRRRRVVCRVKYVLFVDVGLTRFIVGLYARDDFARQRSSVVETHGCRRENHGVA